MGEDEYVSVMLAQGALGQWYSHRIKRIEMICILNRLAKLNLIKWRVAVGSRKYFRKRLNRYLWGNDSVAFTATSAGISYLAKPREII